MNLAVTTMIVLALLIPLAITVHHLVRQQAITDAERRTAGYVAVLAVTTDPAALRRVIRATEGDRPDRVGIHLLPTGEIGAGHAEQADVKQVAGDRRGSVVSVPGGLSLLEPVNGVPKITPVVEVFVPDEDLSHGVGTAWWVLLGVGLFLIIASLAVSDRMAAQVTRSARSLAAGARRLGSGDLSSRITPTGPRELAEAGLAFNAMADRVTDLMAAERELIADLSHRLRTPLTALRLEVERSRDLDADPRLAQAVDAMEHEVDNLINAARRPVEARAGAEPEVCDASEVVRERMAFWSAVADDQSRPFAVYGAQRRSPVPLPRSDLAAALDALLGNVFRYTPQGTAFEVAVSRRDGYVAVRVDDAGPGILDPDRALRRGASQRGSTGLGLDIVRRAAIAGRGDVDIDRSAMGGTSVVVLLADAEPRATPARPRLGFVGRLAREPGERRWGRRGDRP